MDYTYEAYETEDMVLCMAEGCDQTIDVGDTCYINNEDTVLCAECYNDLLSLVD